MKIEEGKYYRTRDGRKVGPVYANRDDSKYWPFRIGDRMWYRHNGSSCPGSVHQMREYDDLIAEWTDGPVFTVGAKVRVTSAYYGKEQLGKTGRVVEVGRTGPLDVEIEYDEPLIHGLKRNQYRSEHLELITDGPVRTVTRREVVEGSYGIVRVDTHRDQVVISIDPSAGHNPTAAELKAAAAVLLELAGALE